MKRKSFKNIVIFLFISIVQFSAVASESISGNWKHASKPALIHFDLKSGVASIKAHDLNKEAEGLILIKNISRNNTTWIGNMFNGETSQYEPVTIKYVSEKEIAVFKADGEEVLRLIRE